MMETQAGRLLGALMAIGVAATACSPLAAAPTAQPTAAPVAAQTPAKVGPTQGTTATAAPPAAASAPAAAVSAANPSAGGGMALRLPTTEPPNMDPGKTSDSQSVKILMHIFEGLTAQDAQGNIQPKLAKSWDVSPDGLTYTFHLQDGPTWSDGKPVTAKDFEWAWKRNIDPKTASDYATSLFPIKNAEKINTGELDKEQLGVTARDDTTLVVTLEKPAAYFLVLASTWTLMPLRQDVVEKFGDQWVEAANIVSEGPYTMKEWTHDQQIVLQANPAYWGPKPSIQQVTFKIFPDGGEDQALQAYEAGELDSLGTILTIPSQQVDRVKADPKLGYVNYDESATYFVTVNNRRDYFKDPRVRKALGMSIERDKLVKDVLHSVNVPAYTLQPVGISGRNPDLWPKEDLAGAKKMLADAGFPDGKGLPELNYTYNTNEGHKLVAEYLQQRWKEALGLNIKLDNKEWKVFLQWRDTDDWRQNGDLFRGGWFSDYEDPNNWYNLLWESNSDPQQFSSGWKDDQYDKIVDQAAGETDPTKRTQEYGEAEKILADQYPNIPIYHYKGQTLTRPYVKGFAPTRVLGVIPFETMSVEAH